jgi:superfamily II DNA or RNA helicase
MGATGTETMLISAAKPYIYRPRGAISGAARKNICEEMSELLAIWPHLPADELDVLRKQANEIDHDASPCKAIVSVMMLKEGWDVRNVTTIVGLRAYAAMSNILPEQTPGRGLRKCIREKLKNM